MHFILLSLLLSSSLLFLVTTNVQSVSIYDNPESCRLTVSCHFARQSKANGCRVNLDSPTSNNTVPVTILISRNDNRELVASSSLSGLQYMSLERDEDYTAECYGVRNGMRLDQLEASSEFELTGNIATERCSGKILTAPFTAKTLPSNIRPFRKIPTNNKCIGLIILHAFNFFTFLQKLFQLKTMTSSSKSDYPSS